MDKLKKIFKAVFSRDFIWRFLFACKAVRQPASLYPLAKLPVLNMNECVENYIQHIETAKFYAQMRGAKYFNFLQPFNGGGHRDISRFDIASCAHMRRRKTFKGDDEQSLLMQFYDQTCARVKDKDYIIDLRNVFDDYRGEIYFDQVHCSDIGHDLIAQKIAERIIAVEHEASSEPQRGLKRAV